METTVKPWKPVVDKLMAGEDYLSFSSLSAFKISPWHFIQYKLGKKEPPTPAMIYGSMVHCYILEPDKFDERYFALDDTAKVAEIGGGNPRATKVYKEWKAEQTSNIGNREIVETGKMQQAKIIGEQVRNNDAVRYAMGKEGENEYKIEWEYMGFKFRGIIDRRKEKENLDIKTCPDAEPRKFHRDVVYNDHYLQGAMYSIGDGGGVKKHTMIAVDGTGGISVHPISNLLMKAGFDEYQRLMTAFCSCIIKEDWDKNMEFFSTQWSGSFPVERPGWMF